ncbi:MAG: aminotransferase class IV [Pyrinomonadaceae bacterium]
MNSRASLYGSGVFTAIRIIKGEPWLWERHWRRLMHGAQKLGIDTSPYSENMLRQRLEESISDADNSKPHKARITITDERPSPLWSDAASPLPANVTFLVSPLREPPRPFRLGISPHLVNSTSPIAGLKTCNYLEQMTSLDEARSRGHTEAIRLNERGHVTSACMANLFWLKDGHLYTPSLSTGCLPGTTREFLLENVNVIEVEAGLQDLTDADAIFLTSAGLGVVQVNEFDRREMANVEREILNVLPV